ncbi:hypothetical protein [Streptomyces sp. RFCAC02]|uniref:cupin domain-containing protein n=1 Tax=Streptomyces sp. RFCAC02 TaxID=2499143 RepID=UPI001020D642|nr:hypothetical protein [Streptomyces sp. RFCAC02]
MQSPHTSQPEVLARVDRVLADGAAPPSPTARNGAVWRLTPPDRQLDANVVRLAAGTTIPPHVEPDLDVLLHVLAGGGRLLTDSGAADLVPGAIAWLPHGARRSLEAGPDGLAYLTAHRRRPGLAIRSAAPAPEAAPEPEGGETACFLHRVCAECGRFAPEADARYCARCGAELPIEAH